jgi:hypothetical protein
MLIYNIQHHAISHPKNYGGLYIVTQNNKIYNSYYVNIKFLWSSFLNISCH